MRIDPVHALECCAAVRYAVSQIPGVSLGVGDYTEADRLRAVRALRPALRELEELRAKLRPSFIRPLSFAEQELRAVLSSVIDAADEAGVRTALYPAQDADEMAMLGGA